MTETTKQGQNATAEYEKIFHDDLHDHLRQIGRVDAHFPEAPDIEELWPKIGESYMPDALREFNDYPTVALGWVMYVGMAIAKYWDTDWTLYAKVPDLYKYLRDRIDFDHLDDYICKQVLLLKDQETAELRNVIAECASRTYNRLFHLHLYPGSESAFRAFVAALHELYLMGAAMQLKDMGYHMTKING